MPKECHGRHSDCCLWHAVCLCIVLRAPQFWVFCMCYDVNSRFHLWLSSNSESEIYLDRSHQLTVEDRRTPHASFHTVLNKMKPRTFCVRRVSIASNNRSTMVMHELLIFKHEVVCVSHQKYAVQPYWVMALLCVLFALMPSIHWSMTPQSV